MIPPLAGRFVAGETAATALEHARQTNDRGIGVILNLLGEHYDERAPADADADAYCALLDDLADTDLRACISVKPSQLGLDVSEDAFRENLARVVSRADAHGRFVWIDMEDHTTTDATLDAYEHHARNTGGADRREGPPDERTGSPATREQATVGVCVQANLKRTTEDLGRLADLPGKVRLVKGAYDPPREVAYREKARVNEAYRELLERMFETFEDGVAVGSHDPAMIDHAEQLHAEYGTPYEVQLLMGVREDAQEELAADREVWQYAPYGGKWFSYFYRRVLERKENATFALRAVMGG